MPELAIGPSLGALLSVGTGRLAEAGCDTPRLDAELLLAEALGVSRERLVIEAAEGLRAPVRECFEALLSRRAAREPIAYILGRKDFRHITLAVDRRVLIPRPETELLVELGLTLPAGARVVDIGTGSGAVALALKHERPDLEVTGLELDGDALEVARANGRALGLEVEFDQADLLAGVTRRFDAVLANLPYVAQGADLAPEITEHEPASALFGGIGGLEVIRQLVGALGEVPLAALEVGFDQADAVTALLRDAGFESVQRLQDLAGHNRVVVGRRT